jgi:hypothetical protein
MMTHSLLDMALGTRYMVVETRNRKTRITFDISRTSGMLFILDYHIERIDSEEYFDEPFMHAILMQLKKHGVHHVITDIIADGLMPLCGHIDKTLYCDLHQL